MKEKVKTLLVVFAVLTIGTAIVADVLGNRSVKAQDSPRQAKNAVAAADIPTDTLQLSTRIWTYKLQADSGPERGETIYFYKCWVCHNEYTIAAGTPAPHLQDLYKSSTLPTGEPLTDESVTAQIKNGNPMMPSFKTTMSDADIADVVSYLKSGKCCVEGENPPPNPWYHASTAKWSVPSVLTGGPRGSVRITQGDPAEGIAVQLIAPSGVRTTVYTNEDGKYEFPKMQTGDYTLRIATPRELMPFHRDGVHVEGTVQLDEIVLNKIADDTEALAPTVDLESELSGSELLWNFTGTAQEKDTFRHACGSGCHSYPQVFRNRYDERSWGTIVNRMFHYSGAPLIIPQKGGSDRGTGDFEKTIVRWLAKVRGPDSKDGPMRYFPRPSGESTRVVVTEYPLPRVLMSAHDVAGDAEGNIWYTSHKSAWVGKLDPRTGIVTEYKVPMTPGVMPGTHRVTVGKDGTVWFSENWSHNLTKFDPKTQQFTQMRIESSKPLNTPGFGNFAVAPDGIIWYNDDHKIQKIDPHTGKIVQEWPMKARESYDNMVSYDGNYWGGGSPPATGGNAAELMDIRTGEVMEYNTGSRQSSAKRGGFDPFGNPWFGGGTGSLVELDAKAKKIREYWPPTPYSPYTDFYEAMPDRNGEVWGGVLHGREFVRLNPKTDKWVEYVMPEPYAHDRRTWIDPSKNPVSVWYVDYSMGTIVRIQPME